jgi:hypothetical protein
MAFVRRPALSETSGNQVHPARHLWQPSRRVRRLVREMYSKLGALRVVEGSSAELDPL